MATNHGAAMNRHHWIMGLYGALMATAILSGIVAYDASTMWKPLNLAVAVKHVNDGQLVALTRLEAEALITSAALRKLELRGYSVAAICAALAFVLVLWSMNRRSEK